jgi:DNA-binding IclR family transcriptional regulator
MSVEEKEDRGVATLERALAILGTFESSSSQSLADISRRTGLYKSTLLRLLGTLQKFCTWAACTSAGYSLRN